MKVLFVSPFPPARDGIGNYTSVLAAAIRARGCDVRVLVPSKACADGADVVGSLSWLPSGARATRANISQFGPDLVHVQFAVPAFGLRTLVVRRWVRTLRRDLGVPIIFTMHEVTRDTARLRGIGRALYRGLARNCDVAIVHTHAASRVLTGPVGLAEGQVRVIPHPAARPPDAGVEPAELRRRFGIGDARILLAFGFIHVDKGLQDVVAALSAMRAVDPSRDASLRVVLAGTVRRRRGPFRFFEARDHWHLRRVLRMAERRGVRHQLVRTGYVPDQEVVGWFRACEAVLLPYRRTEQSGVAGLAIALDRPVLASRVGGLDEQFGGSPWSFPPGDAASLARVMTDFLTASPESVTGSWHVSDSADIPVVAAATLDTYASALGGAAGRLAHVG